MNNTNVPWVALLQPGSLHFRYILAFLVKEVVRAKLVGRHILILRGLLRPAPQGSLWFASYSADDYRIKVFHLTAPQVLAKVVRGIKIVRLPLNTTHCTTPTAFPVESWSSPMPKVRYIHRPSFTIPRKRPSSFPSGIPPCLQPGTSFILPSKCTFRIHPQIFPINRPSLRKHGAYCATAPDTLQITAVRNK